MKLTVEITTNIITEIGVNLKPMLKVSSSVNFNHVILKGVMVGYNPSTPRPTPIKYS